MWKAEVREIQLTIPTYELLIDDINPIFDKKLNPYPYTMQNNRAKEKIEKLYDAVVLENEYLKITLLPSLGGRVYSAVDKRNGQEFLYRNRVIKPRMVSNRGAWFSGGMEFNFPISHSPTTMDRVNYSCHEYTDGSASIVFGNIEQMSFMNWKLELRLYPDKAYMEQNVFLTNPTPCENRFYFWTNVAVEYNSGLELIYPFDWCINQLDSRYIKWPFYQDTDCRNASEIPFAYETFGKLMNHNYFGIYNHNDDFGLVHYANRKQVKGAKFFSWGNDDNGKAWNKALTDDDSQYIEIQSGPFESQAVFKFLKPHQCLTWSEYWYPISKMNGFKYADKEVAVNYEITDKEITFYFAANSKLKDCRLILSSRGLQYQSDLNVTPEKNAKIGFQLEQHLHGHPWTLDLYCSSRHVIRLEEPGEFSEEYPDHAIYEDSRLVIDEKDEENTLKLAQFKESLGAIGEAVALYEKNLEQYPYCTITLNRLGQLYLKTMQFKKAEKCFVRALQYDNRNSQARYNLAVVRRMQGKLPMARRLWMDIASDSEYYKPSVIELAKANIALGYYKEAQSLLETYKNENNYLSWLLSIAYRKDGLMEASKSLLNEVTHPDEYHFTERYILEQLELVKREWLDFTKGDEKVLLPIALDYIEMGLYKDAEKILQSIGHPDMKVNLALLGMEHYTGRFNSDLFNSTLTGSLDYVFVNEPRIVQILIGFQDQDHSGVIDYLMGTYYLSVSRTQEALECYSSAYKKGLRYTVLLHNLGYIYYIHEHNSQMAERFFVEDAISNQGQNEGTLVYLDKIYAEQGEKEKRKGLIKYMENAKNKSVVQISLVDAYKQFGKEDKALAILENDEFENWEGEELSGLCYRDVIVYMALKKLEQNNIQTARKWIDRVDQYPDNLNYGDSARTALSEINYYKGIIYRKSGKIEEALQYFKAGYLELNKDEVFQTEQSRMFGFMCLKELI